MSEKEIVRKSVAYRLLHPMHTVIVSCGDKQGKPNLTTMAWAMPASFSPPLVAISLSPKRYSHSLIQETKEFVINIPSTELIQQTLKCGTTSGKNLDKFAETNLTQMASKKVKPPAIKECIAHLECKLHSHFIVGDHTIFVGEIIEAYTDKGIFEDKYDLEKAPMLYHTGGNTFVTLNPKNL